MKKWILLILVSLVLTACYDDGDDIVESIKARQKKAVEAMQEMDQEEAEIIKKTADSSLPTHINQSSAVLTDPAPYHVRPLFGIARQRQRQLTPMINELALSKGVDPAIIHAIISRESAYNKVAASGAGAVGLMQLMPATGKELGLSPDQRTNPRLNVVAGIKYFKKGYKYLDKKLQAAIAGYNCGHGCASVLLRNKTKAKMYKTYGGPRLNGVPDKSFWKGETYNYVGYVTGFYNLYKAYPNLIGLAPQKTSSIAHQRGEI